MADNNELVVIITNGFSNERSSVGWSVANGGIATGFKVTIFLVSSGVDWVRKGATAQARLNPLDPSIGEMIQNLVDHDTEILVCPPCAGVRGYTADDLMDGVTLAGSVAMLEKVKNGAATLTF